MERVAKVVLILSVVLMVFASNGEGARTLKSNENKGTVDEPQTFFGRSFPTPGFSGTFPSPGLGGSFPSPGFSGSFPSPGFRFGPPAAGNNFCMLFPGTAGCSPPAQPGNHPQWFTVNGAA